MDISYKKTENFSNLLIFLIQKYRDLIYVLRALYYLFNVSTQLRHFFKNIDYKNNRKIYFIVSQYQEEKDFL